VKKNLLFFLLNVAFSMLCFSQTKNIVWDYPIKPGTEEWATFKSGQEMIEACQIPENVLENLSTSDLAYLCLNYPLLGDMLFFDNYQEGFEKMSASFNGFPELFKREDAGTELLKLYQEFDLDSFKNSKGIGRTNVFYDMCIDIVMAQPIFLEKLDQQQETYLIKESVNRLSIRQKMGDSFYRQRTTAVVLSRLLTKNGYALKEVNQFGKDKYLLLNNSYILENEDMIEKIKQKAIDYLRQ
jgi:hypothetical protein